MMVLYPKLCYNKVFYNEVCYKETALNKAEKKEESELLFVSFFIKIRCFGGTLCLLPLTRNRLNLPTLKDLNEHIHAHT